MFSVIILAKQHSIHRTICFHWVWMRKNRQNYKRTSIFSSM